MSTYFYDLPYTLPKRHPIIHPADPTSSVRIISIPELYKKADESMESSDFVYPRMSFVNRCLVRFLFPLASSIHPLISTWIIADFDTPRGEKILFETLDAMVSLCFWDSLSYPYFCRAKMLLSALLFSIIPPRMFLQTSRAFLTVSSCFRLQDV